MTTRIKHYVKLAGALFVLTFFFLFDCPGKNGGSGGGGGTSAGRASEARARRNKKLDNPTWF
jgi:hypothetical protein